MKFKQDRVLFFIASPQDEAPNVYPVTRMQKFYGVNFHEDALPALMLVKGEEQSVVFYENIETLTEDKLAGWIYDHVFQDLTFNQKIL